MTLGLILAKIQIPAEAVVPLLVGVAALLVLLFAGAALKDWKDRSPKRAELVGMIVAIALTGYALYMAATIIPAKYIDHGAPGEKSLGFLDGPIAGFAALIGTLFWRFAGKRWIALGLGVALGIALFLKPFVLPLHSWYDGRERPWDFMDPEHLSFHGPGVAVIIAALVAGSKRG